MPTGPSNGRLKSVQNYTLLGAKGIIIIIIIIIIKVLFKHLL